VARRQACTPQIYNGPCGVAVPDARESEPFITTAWCHGATGIDIAAAGLFVRTGRDRYADYREVTTALLVVTVS
jgi:hypothetical protein